MEAAMNYKAGEEILRGAIEYVANETVRQSFLGSLDKMPPDYYAFKAAGRTLHVAFYENFAAQQAK